MRKVRLSAVEILHQCPYKTQDVSLALCYLRSQDIKHDFCYACDHVEVNLLPKFGLRTFRRVLKPNYCRRCREPASNHNAMVPYSYSRVGCPGFVDGPDIDSLQAYVTTTEDRTEWMVVDFRNGIRKTWAEYSATFPGMTDEEQKRRRLPLVGAPGTVPSDRRDELRLSAAKAAATNRGRPVTSVVSAEDEVEKPKPARKRQAKGRSRR